MAQETTGTNAPRQSSATQETLNQEALLDKLDTLKAHLARHPKLAVAFSAGVDSTFLLAVAHEVLGDAACALTAKSPTFPERELSEAKRFCEERSIRQIVFETHEFDLGEYVQNPPNRCYLCKRELFSQMLRLAQEQDLGPIMDGSNTDDLSDYRPGHKALEEMQIESPLVACGFSKQDIRDASRLLGLPTADKPSFACLASRFPYGTPLAIEALEKVDAAEQLLLDLGVETVRVRVNGEEARIEVLPADFGKVLESREHIASVLREIGFAYVALDLVGFRSGALNEVL